MTRRIDEDWTDFRRIIGGRFREALKKFFRTSRFVTARGKNGKISITVPKIDIPHIVYGDSDDGIGRGPGEKGDVIGRDPQEGDPQAGQEEGEGIIINITMEEILAFMQEELQLPDLKPKPNQTYEDIRIKYNDIALTGPESLRHNRRTMLQALKRMAASGELDKLHMIPGFKDPVKLITPINSDKRYRMYKEIRIPSSNAVIMFGRDGSASMDQYKCDIVSDMCWWIDVWIRRYYEKVERCYFWHDTVAQEVDEDKFYKYRYGGGTTCSTCPKLMAKQFENRFPPEKWNIYCFYFTDGENWGDDNEIYVEMLKKEFPPEICNLFAVTQVLCWNYNGSLKKYLDDAMVTAPNYRSASIGDEKTPDFTGGIWSTPSLSNDDRNDQVRKAIRHLLGSKDMVTSNEMMTAV
jgi:uncharacterized sporulation protein YeaH/YhbH (DUF444 family)